MLSKNCLNLGNAKRFKAEFASLKPVYDEIKLRWGNQDETSETFVQLSYGSFVILFTEETVNRADVYDALIFHYLLLNSDRKLCLILSQNSIIDFASGLKMPWNKGIATSNHLCINYKDLVSFGSIS